MRAAAAAACLAALLVAAGWALLRSPSLPDARVGHVVVISIDGLRPDAIEAAGAPTLRRMMREGAYSLTARTVFPSATLPGHTSMLTGVSPAKHGVTWNWDRTEETGRVAVPTVFDLADSAGLAGAAFFGKSKLRQLLGDGGDGGPRVEGPEGEEVLEGWEVVQKAENHLRFRRPDLLFIHIVDPDLRGHSQGWMSEPYLRAVRHADELVGRIQETARARFGDDVVLIVTADHGGHARVHETRASSDMLIPWVAWGSGVAKGRLRGPVRTEDTAATVLWLLGIPRPAGWEGRPVTAAFVPG
jgi:arylsulfatase A-like enzyme